MTVSQSSATPPVVEIHGVRYSVGSRRIFDGLDLTVQKGSITAVMGPSGTGKTTVLRLLTGQIRASAGTVRALGHEVGSLGHRELFALRRRIGMLFQNGALLTDLDVFENVAYPVREHARLPEPVLRRLVLMKLEAVGLRGAEGLMPQQLSGGMARRVALARAIALDPELVMYDEPFAGLDPISLGTAAQLIRQLNDAMGLTSILVSHDLEVTFALADHVVILGPGTIAAQGTPDEVRNSQDPLVHQFVHALPTGPVPFHYPGPTVAQDFGPLPGGRP
jgi:phospholipid/cholesterol/gamma-HCH transport system ATP-binding protein